LEGGRARVFPGDYAYYLWRKQQEAAAPEAAEAGLRGLRPAILPAEQAGAGFPPVGPAASAQPLEPASTAAEARLQAKRLQGDLRRLAREEEGILAELERLAAARRELEKALSDREVYRDGARVKLLKQELDGNTRRQEELTSRWEAVDRELQSRR